MAATLPSRRPPRQKSLSPPRVAQYDPYAHQLGSLSENIHRLLTERECSIYDRGLTDYHRRRHIRAFVECLSLVLNTNHKRQLLIPIRDSYIKPSDLQKFNQLALELGLATPLKKRKSDMKDGVRKIEIKRNPDGEWGFNIRGGSEHGIGIFVSSVERGSNAEKVGLKAGDQIKKANDLNCESVTHQEAVAMMRNSKKLQLWVLSRGHVPTSRMAHKVYNWVDPHGRPASPPPDPFEVQEQISSSSRQLMNQADERKVTMMIESGQELGISIRGGAEHGLGIYISAVERGSVAEAYGVTVGDQILEVNGISFLGIVHSDAAHALRAQPCMVMKLKDVGKLPHSRVTTLGKTQWHSTGGSRTLPHKGSHSPVFTPGYGTQVMLTDQENSFQVRGMMNEMARSVLTSQELNTFNYYVDQYDQKALSVDDLVTPMLHLLNTPEKLQLLSEMHVAIKPRDLQRFNELTVHKALAVKKAGAYHGHPGESHERYGGAPSPSFKQHSTPKSKGGPVKRSVVAQVHSEEPSGHFQINPYENEDYTLTHDSSSEEGGRDKVPQKLSPTHLTFHAPPPPSSAPTHRHAAPRDNTTEDTWSAAWNETSMMSPPPKGGSSSDADSSINVSEIESRVRSETEERLRQQFEEQQKKLIDEQTRKMRQEKAELEEKIRREAEESMKKQLREKEEALARMSHKNQEKSEDKAQLEEEIKRELEEKIWKEAEEHLKIELEKKMQRELDAAKSEIEETDYGANVRASEDEIRQEMEQKYKREYEEKIRREQDKWKRKEEEERRKQEQEAKHRQEEEIARLEAEEQARIELEDRIRREAEASARAEYEARLQHETEERARLAEEVKARKAMEERMEKERKEREKKEREREQQREREREQERKRKEREPQQKVEAVRDAAEEEESECSEEEEEPTPKEMTAEEKEEQRMLEIQRRRRIQEQKEEQRREEAQKRALAAEKAKKDEELAKKRELARKREENIRKLDEERKQKEAEARQRREEERKKKQQRDEEEKQNTIERERQLHGQKKQEEEAKRQRDRAEAARIRKQKEQEQQNKGDSNRLMKMGGKQVMVSGAAKNGAVPTKRQALSPKSTAAAVEEERNKAEELLEKRLREKQETKSTDAYSGPSFSYAGYNDLRGELRHILITKVVRKLGIAIDGGANTKQKAVIIREISPEGCAGQTAPELKVDQQLLEIEGQTLHGLKHKDVVMAIKHAFEGELGKVIDFTILDPSN